MLVYFAGIVILGALLAPPLFWGAQWLVGHGIFPALAKVDFESFFHRALLIAALVLLWPLLQTSNVRTRRDLALEPNRGWFRDLLGGFALAAIPLLCFGAIVIGIHIYSLRNIVKFAGIAQVIGATLAVPVIEEIFFRGLVLGILLRSGRVYWSMFLSSAFFAIVHFLKAPDRTSAVVTWSSGFNSVAHSLAQFADPVMVAAAFTTLFLLGWILADARVRTRSLWLPAGLHAGWIFTAGVFNKIARRELLALPWLGKNLLVGLVPLAVALVTWLLLIYWKKKHDRSREV